MPRPVAILLLLLLLVSAVLLLVVANPSLVLRPVLHSYLLDSGYRLRSLEGLNIRSSAATATTVVLESDSTVITVQDLSVSFTLSQLFARQIDHVSIDSLLVQKQLTEPGGSGSSALDSNLNSNLNSNLDSNVSSSPGSALSYGDLLNTFSTLPLNSITVQRGELLLPQGGFAGTLEFTTFEFTTRPASLRANGSWSGAESFAIDIASDMSEGNRISAALTVSQDRDAIINGKADLEFTQDGIDVSGEMAMNAQALSRTLMPQQLADRWIVLDDSLALSFSAKLEPTVAAPALRSMQVTLDGPGSALQIQSASGGTRNTIQLSLPVTATVAANADTNGYDIEFPGIHGTVAVLGENIEINAETSLGNLGIHCGSWRNCSSDIEFQVLLPAWHISGARGENLRLGGGLHMDLSPGMIELRGEETVLQLENVRFEQWTGAAELALNQALVTLGSGNGGQFRFASNSLTLQSEELQLISPSISGVLDFAGNAVAGSMDLAVGEQSELDNPLAHTVFNHSFNSNSGALELTLPERRYSARQPLSSLLQQQWIDADVVAGSMQGEAKLSWKLEDGQWQLSGPARLRLDALSGHVEETLLLGLSTVASAEVQGWERIISDPGLTASIDEINTGLPLHNLQWRYGFDTEAGNIQIQELNSELFDGTVEIADFTIDPANMNQQLTVVLSRLNLESIVGLAGYPGLFVDGLISGYIPVTLREGQILVNDGLVAALNPGGSIRYTPETAAPVAANSTLQLVNDALSNYQYETLDTRFFYDESGDLRMEVALTGRNADMNGGQAINLNVNITDNIPSLLRSLKAGQAISERLEQQLQNR